MGIRINYLQKTNGVYIIYYSLNFFFVSLSATPAVCHCTRDPHKNPSLVSSTKIRAELWFTEIVSQLEIETSRKRDFRLFSFSGNMTQLKAMILTIYPVKHDDNAVFFRVCVFTRLLHKQSASVSVELTATPPSVGEIYLWILTSH